MLNKKDLDKKQKTDNAIEHTVCALTSKYGLISSKVLVMVASSTEGAMATTRSIIESLRDRSKQSKYTDIRFIKDIIL